MRNDFSTPAVCREVNLTLGCGGRRADKLRPCHREGGGRQGPGERREEVPPAGAHTAKKRHQKNSSK